jgi:hypothetical protein
MGEKNKLIRQYNLIANVYYQLVIFIRFKDQTFPFKSFRYG